MECPRCGLDNMPGSNACFQCQADLASPAPVADAAAVPLYPGRGTRRGLQGGLERARTPPAASRFRPPAADALAPFRAEIVAATRSLLPGLGQHHNHEPRKAGLFAAAAVVLLLANVATFFTPHWSFSLSLLMALIAASMLDAALVSLGRRTGKPFTAQPGVAGGLALLVLASVLSLHLMATAIAARFVIALRIPADVAAFKAGDTMLALPIDATRTPLARGDLVVAGFGDLQVRGMRIVPGDALAWVVGLPGETLVFANGQILKDGAAIGDLKPARLESLTGRFEAGESYIVVRLGFYRFADDFFLGIRSSRGSALVASMRASDVTGRVSMPPEWLRTTR